MVEAKKSVEYMNNNLHKIKIIGLAADQCPRIDNKVHWKKFLNQETAFYRGIELVPKNINCKVFLFNFTPCYKKKKKSKRFYIYML